MNSIDYSKLRNLTAQKLIRALERDGFVFSRQSGSHQIYLPSRQQASERHFSSSLGYFSDQDIEAHVRRRSGLDRKADLKRLKLLKD